MTAAAALQHHAVMARVVEFVVYGEALGQGSMQTTLRTKTDPATGKRIVKSWARHSNPDLLLWRHAIESAIQQQVGGVVFHEGTPVRVCIVFYVKRPASLPKRVTKPVTGRDLDKLARAACDAMSATVYADDKQVTDLHVKKRYAVDGRPRAVFFLTEDDEIAESAPASWPDMPRLF